MSDLERIIGGTSWLAHFDVEMRRRIKVRNVNQTPTLQNERVPDASEIAEVFARAPLRTAAMISLMSKSGVRPKVMGNYDGTDGLRMRDLPDVVIHQGMAKCIRMPCQIVVRAELSKTRHQYFTFLTASGTTKLLAYLNDRLACGEPLHGDSAVIAPDHRHAQTCTASHKTRTQDVYLDAADRQGDPQDVPPQIPVEALRTAGLL